MGESLWAEAHEPLLLPNNLGVLELRASPRTPLAAVSTFRDCLGRVNQLGKGCSQRGGEP
jgi:hypothetical protein